MCRIDGTNPAHEFLPLAASSRAVYVLKLQLKAKNGLGKNAAIFPTPPDEGELE